MDKQQSSLPKILFVDDEPNVLSAMQRLFHGEPYEIITALDGSSAFKLLKETESIQLIISDYRMPGMNGVEFLQKIMQFWPETRRVILSGYTDSDILLAALNEGRVHRFLVKPWDNDAIKTVVKEMLGEYEILVNFRRGAEELAYNNRLLSRTNENLSNILADVLDNMRRNAVPDERHVVGTENKNLDLLSSRECEIMHAIASGKSLKVIAMDLGLSIKTVSTYKKRLFDKMVFKNNAELICYVLKNNLPPNSSM